MVFEEPPSGPRVSEQWDWHSGQWRKRPPPIVQTLDDLPVRLFAQGIREVRTTVLAVVAVLVMFWLAWRLGSDLPWGM